MELSDDDKLVFYVYFKQVIVGDCNIGIKVVVVFKLNFLVYQFINLSILDFFNLVVVGSYL